MKYAQRAMRGRAVSQSSLGQGRGQKAASFRAGEPGSANHVPSTFKVGDWNSAAQSQPSQASSLVGTSPNWHRSVFSRPCWAMATPWGPLCPSGKLDNARPAQASGWRGRGAGGLRASGERSEPP